MKPMTGVRTQRGQNENDPSYVAGYKAAQENMRRDLATALRIHAVQGRGNGEVLSDMMVREIFAAVFGVVAMDAEFGPEPTGMFDTRNLDDFRDL